MYDKIDYLSYYPLMLGFKYMKQKAMGTDNSPHSFNNLNAASQSQLITFGALKQLDANYQAIFNQRKPSPVKIPQLPYLCHSPL